MAEAIGGGAEVSIKIVDGIYVCAKCSVILRIKETREHMPYQGWGVLCTLNVWECINCSRTWRVWQGPKSEEPKSENLRMMKKGKRIKKLEERVALLEHQIETLEARSHWWWYCQSLHQQQFPRQPYSPGVLAEAQSADKPYNPPQAYSPITTDGAVAES